ncbi:MAG: DUF1232 domain-containing protein [Armatimonadota bacterium]|nr:DUF1232 domain-containing protein [Armatimonadota bacterium]MCX7776898.1 DUF1232 domain-containing protein [Armatimonadota bacterium]MDW8024416.1 DUF1232 domain-containing protein [Armatimonadota bacterium]
MWRLIWHLPNIVRLCARLMSDRRVPITTRLILPFALLCIVAYIATPFDVLPEIFIPAVGLLDDVFMGVLIVVAAISLFFRLCPNDVLWEHIDRIKMGE